MANIEDLKRIITAEIANIRVFVWVRSEEIVLAFGHLKVIRKK